MNRIRLLIIDPQNDFMDIAGAALPVAGADADMHRLAGFIARMSASIDDIVVTMDSHASVGIERTTFWLQADGSPVEPFTAIRAADVQNNQYRPRNILLRDQVIDYLQSLEKSGERTLVVWPVHCVLGTWGHNLHAQLAASIAQWEMQSGRTCEKVLKGLNPMTEQYSAFRAEVPLSEDARTHLNTLLLQRLQTGSPWLVVAGEALSHCVAASGDDMLRHLSQACLARTVFLQDGMSPVTGFERDGSAFLDRLRSAGVRVMPSFEAIDLLQA